MAALIFIPLLVFAGLAAHVAGLGVMAWWGKQAGTAAPLWLSYLASGALHMAWIYCAASRQSPLCLAVAFLLSLSLCSHGLRALPGGHGSLLGPMLIEGLPLMTAWMLRPPLRLSERLARWRRARAEIALQLRMGDGLLPWARDSARRLIVGKADLPVCPNFRRLAAQLAETAWRPGPDVSILAAPEELRQFVQTGASELLVEAERAAAALAVELERRSIDLAAACREQCEAISGLTTDDRARLARQCETFLLNLPLLAGIMRRREEP